MTKTIKTLALLLLLTSFTSCDFLKALKLSEKEGLDNAKEIVTSQFPDKDFTSVRLSTKDALSEEFDMVYVTYFDNTVNNIVTQNFIKSVGKVSDPDASSIKREKGKTFKASEINWDTTLAKATEALATINKEMGKEYTNFRLVEVQFKAEKESLVTSYIVSMTKIGEATTRQGRMINTNYYEVQATVNADGTMSFEEY